MKNPKQRYILLVLDWLLLVAAYGFSIKLHSRLDIDLVFAEFPFLATEIWFYIAYTSVIIFIFYINGLYYIHVYLTVTKQFQLLLRSMFFSIIGLVLLSFFTKLSVIVESRLIILYYLGLSVGLLVMLRILIVRTVLVSNFLSLIPPRKLLIIGAEAKGIELATLIRRYYSFGLKTIGFLDDNIPVGTVVHGGHKVIGLVSEYRRMIELLEIDEVVLCLENTSDESYLELIEGLSETKARVLIASDKFKVISTLIPREFYGSIPVIGVLNSIPYVGLKAVKRLGDLVLTTLFTIILTPLFILIGVLIKLDSRGPILYKQIRLGKNGKPFTFYKFRSMYSGSDRDKARVQKLREFINEGENGDSGSTKIVNESQVTRVGRFIRKTSIDELPQLFNVIKGDMSLVGPRPCLPYEWESYSDWHKKRLSVTPGCTGIWQVFGRSTVGFRDMAILDMYYIYNISFHLDIWLIMKTVPVMIFGTGGK